MSSAPCGWTSRPLGEKCAGIRASPLLLTPPTPTPLPAGGPHWADPRTAGSPLPPLQPRTRAPGACWGRGGARASRLGDCGAGGGRGRSERSLARPGRRPRCLCCRRRPPEGADQRQPVVCPATLTRPAAPQGSAAPTRAPKVGHAGSARPARPLARRPGPRAGAQAAQRGVRPGGPRLSPAATRSPAPGSQCARSASSTRSSAPTFAAIGTLLLRRRAQPSKLCATPTSGEMVRHSDFIFFNFKKMTFFVVVVLYFF